MGNNIRKLRVQAGLSQIKLAELVGVSRYTIIQLEAPNTKKILTEKLSNKMCEIFKCSKIELYGMSIFRLPIETDEDKQKVIEILTKGG